jgi:hypothetical protein
LFFKFALNDSIKLNRLTVFFIICVFPKIGGNYYLFPNCQTVFLMYMAAGFFVYFLQNLPGRVIPFVVMDRYFLFIRGEVWRSVKRRLWNCLLPKFALIPTFFMNRGILSLKYTAAEFLLALLKSIFLVGMFIVMDRYSLCMRGAHETLFHVRFYCAVI